MKLALDSNIGGDIVFPLIASIAEKYTPLTRSFRVMDISKDALPDCHLILPQNRFIHLSFEAIFVALKNITQSKHRYLLSTHSADVAENVDIGTGTCRSLTFYAAPFQFSARPRTDR